MLMAVNKFLLRSAMTGALGGLLFGFDTAVIAGTTHALSEHFVLGPFELGFTVSIALWGTVLHPPAYEVQGEFVARAAPDLILVRHTAISALGMSSMEQMAVSVSPAQVDPLGLKPGDQVRLGVRQQGEQLVLLRIERRR